MVRDVAFSGLKWIAYLFLSRKDRSPKIKKWCSFVTLRDFGEEVRLKVLISINNIKSLHTKLRNKIEILRRKYHVTTACLFSVFGR